MREQAGALASGALALALAFALALAATLSLAAVGCETGKPAGNENDGRPIAGDGAATGDAAGPVGPAPADGPLASDSAPRADAGGPTDGAAPRDATVTVPETGDPNGVVRFAALGDTGDGSADQARVAAAIKAKCAMAGCDFVQLLGDNIYESGVTSVTDPQWQSKFEMPYLDIVLPFYVVLGNHDYGGNGTGSEFAKGQFQIDYTAVSMKWKLPAAYYRRAVKQVEFFALDTNSQMYGRDAQQKTDVAAWLAASTATWKIAVGHHPYRSNGSHGNAGSYEGLPIIPVFNGAGVKTFMEEIVCGKADLYLSGHDHSRQWLMTTCQGTELIVSGAGASVTELGGSNPFHFQNLELGFVYVLIDGRRLTAEFIDATGKLEFTRTITKP
jgi:hypothetical protein